MSNSYRKSPVNGRTTATSEKSDKRNAHQAQRAHFRTQANSARDITELDFDERSFAHSNKNCFAKDGKTWVSLQVKRVGRALRILARPPWVGSDREARRPLAK